MRQPARRDRDAELLRQFAGQMFVEQHVHGMLVRDCQHGEGGQRRTVPAQRQQGGLVAGDDDVERFPCQQRLHRGQPVAAIAHPRRDFMQVRNVAGAQGRSGEVAWGRVHLHAPPSKGTHDREEASGIVAEHEDFHARHAVVRQLAPVPEVRRRCPFHG